MAVVVDDHLMEITHILRGEEWLPSTPKQIILYKMFGWDCPTFAHVPLLLNPDKKKLSKRQGDVAVEDFLKKGYLKETLLNFVGTLGFNPKSDQEIYSLEELIKLFDLSKVNKSGAVLNIEKLDWMNHHYMNAMDVDSFFKALEPFAVDLNLADERVRRAVLIERPRLNRLSDFTTATIPYRTRVDYEKDILVWRKADENDARDNLAGVKGFLEQLPESTFEDMKLIEEAIKGYITERGLSNGNVLWPLRVSLSGMEASASPFEYLWVLGRGEGMERIERAIAMLS